MKGKYVTAMEDTRLAAARAHFEECFRLSRKHKRVFVRALEIFGDHGPQISGIIRTHFPERWQQRLRALCREMNESRAQGFKARPPRVHKSTMTGLYRSVRNRVGSGFYC